MLAAHVRSHVTVDLPLVAHLLGNETGLRVRRIGDEDRKIRNVDEAERARSIASTSGDLRSPTITTSVGPR